MADLVLLKKREAMWTGLVGGVLAGIPSYLVVGDIDGLIINFDWKLVMGILARMGIFGGLGVLYTHLAPLPIDKWTAFERGVMAPAIIMTLVTTYSPTSATLDTLLSSQQPSVQLIGSALANQHTSAPPPPTSPPTTSPPTTSPPTTSPPTIIRQIIRGILGK